MLANELLFVKRNILSNSNGRFAGVGLISANLSCEFATHLGRNRSWFGGTGPVLIKSLDRRIVCSRSYVSGRINDVRAGAMKPPFLKVPDIIGVGPGRTGTTWLHESLKGSICLPRIKEIHYFKSYYSKGLEWYAWHFRNCPADVPRGEICATYFNFAPAIGRILRDLPNCKIICTVRDPVARAYSHYKQMRPLWGTTASFEEALKQYPSIIDASMYALHLRRWLDVFGPERVLTLFYDDLKGDPQGYLDSACAFIGIPAIELQQTQLGAKKANFMEAARLPWSRRLASASSIVYERLRSRRMDIVLDYWQRSGLWEMCVGGGKKYGPISNVIENRLREYFRPDVEQLEVLTERDLSKWKCG